MNNLKTLMLMVLLGAIMIFIGGLVGGKGGMMIMLMISLGMNFFSYWFSDSVVLKMYNAREVSREEAPQLYGLVENLAAPSTGDVEADWQRAVLQAATEHVLTKTALSERDRDVYRFYVQERHAIEEVAEKFHITRNSVSQIKTRIEKRIATIGREMAAAADRI